MERSRKIIIQVLLATIIIGPALALGAVHAEVLAVFLLLSSFLFIYLLVSKRLGEIVLDLPGVIFICLIAYTLLQLVPLPVGLVKLVSPLAADVRTRALIPLGIESPNFIPITLDSTFTVQELGKLLLYAGVYWTCLSWTRKRGSKFITNLVIAVGVLAAAVFLLHKILILDKVYGIYSPIHIPFGHDRSSAPLINENHMAGLLGLCSAVTFGRALASKDKSKRILFIALTGLVGGSLLLTMSRGGIAAFLGGQLLFVLLRVIHRLTKEKGESTPLHLAWLPMGLAVSLGLGLFVAQDAILGEFVEGSVKKLELIGEGLPLIREFMFTGVGRGSFWVGLPLVSDIGFNSTFTHAENAVIQVLADYGMIVGGLALLSSFMVISRFLRNPPSRVDHAALLVALIGFGLHNLVDFNMEVPGVAILAVALLGVLVGSRTKPKRKDIKPIVRVPRPLIAGLAAVALFLSVIIGLHFAARTVTNEEQEMRRALVNRTEEPFSTENIRDALTRHPSAWYFPFVKGVWIYHMTTGNPMPWFARAIELNSASPSAHFYAGRTFLRVGKMDQALLEFRLGARLDQKFAPHAARLLVAKVPNFKDLSPIAVDRNDKLLLWGALAREFGVQGLENESEAADLSILKVDQRNPNSLARQAKRLLGRKQTDEAFKLADSLSKLPKYGPAGAQIKAQIYWQLGENENAVEVLEKEFGISPKNAGLITSLAWAKQRAGDLDGAIEVAGILRSMSASLKKQAAVALLEANLAKAAGRMQVALARLSEAHALDPLNTKILLQIAALAERTNDTGRLLEALKKLNAIDPQNESVKNRLKKLNDKKMTKDLMMK